MIAGPAAVAHRPARLAWEQTGLPLLAQQVGAKVLHSPFYTCPLRAGCPVTVTVHDATFFTEPEHYDNTKRTFFRTAIKTSLRRAARVIVPSKATRDELIRLLDADPTRIDVAYHGVDPAAFHAPTEEEKARVRARLGLGDAGYVAFLGAKEPRKNVPNLIRGWVPRGGATGRTRRRWSSPAARATTTTSTGRWPRCRRTCGCCARATCATPTCPASSAARWWPATRPSARASACRSSRRWPAARRCSPRRGCRCPRSAATRSPTPTEDPDQIAEDLADLLHDEPRRLTLAKAGLRPGEGVHLGLQRRGARRRRGPGWRP